jgi:hypothetical protein
MKKYTTIKKPSYLFDFLFPASVERCFECGMPHFNLKRFQWIKIKEVKIRVRNDFSYMIHFKSGGKNDFLSSTSQKSFTLPKKGTIKNLTIVTLDKDDYRRFNKEVVVHAGDVLRINPNTGVEVVKPRKKKK